MSVAAPLLSAHGLRKVHVQRPVLDDVTFTIHEGDRVALLGVNGAGKSTLLRILAGRMEPDAGEVRRRRDLRMAHLDQEGDLRLELTIGETLREAFTDLLQAQAALDEVHLAMEAESDPTRVAALMRRHEELAHILEGHDPHTAESRMAETANALGLPAMDRRLSELSGGERRRVALCRTLLREAELLLLDEPTNHLDAETLDWLEDRLAEYRGTVVFVTHDRYFLDNVATKMVELSRGQTRVYPGNYSDYLDAKQAEAAAAATAESVRQNLLRRELEWLRRQPKARTTKAKARVDRAEALLASKPLEPDGTVQLLFPTGPRLGRTAIEAEELACRMGDRTLLQGFSLIVRPGDRIGIVGPNGAGKTTLIRTLIRELPPHAGTVVHNQHVRVIYGDQNRTLLDPEKTVLDEVAGGHEWIQLGEQRIGFRAWLARFLFDDNLAATPVRLLSGGERNRVQLAKLLREGGNVLVLDEPTNDLDLATLRVLEESLAAYPGVALIVSHDRYFLNRVANRIVALRGDGRGVVVEGNYDHYRSYLTRVSEKEPAESKPREAPRVEAAPAKREPAVERRKLSNKERAELESMEATILEAEGRLADLEAKLADPASFSGKDKAAIARMVAEADATRVRIAALYERWAELDTRA